MSIFEFKNRDLIIRICDKLSEWSIYLLIFCLPFSKTVIEAAITIAFICFVIKKIALKEKFLLKSPLYVPFIIFALCLIPSFFNTYDILFSLKALVSKYLKYLFLVMIMIDVINSSKKIKNLLTICVLSFVITISNAFIQYYITHADLFHNHAPFKYRPDHAFQPFIGFPTASFPYPNDFGAWLIIFIAPIMALTFMSLSRLRNRFFYGALFSPAFYMLMLTKARSAWLGFFAGVGFLFFFKMKKWVIILLILSIGVYLGINKKIGHYVAQVTSVEDRMEMWGNGWKIFKEHPIIGNGINTFFEKYKEVRNDSDKNQRGSYAHNCYLQIAADTGIIGLGAFLYLLFIFFKATISETIRLKAEFYKIFNLGLMAGLSAYLVQSFFDTNLFSLPLAALFWFTLGFSRVVINVGKLQNV